MKNLLFVAAGGAIGASLRYLAGIVLRPDDHAGFPLHTFLVNITGCLLIGLVFAYTVKHSGQHVLQYFVATGIIGGFTTFSSFSMEAIYLLDVSRGMRALFYIVLSNICGIGAAWLGYNFHKLAG